MTRLDRLTERLDLKEFQLRALLEITKAINSNVGRRDLLQLYVDIMTNELGITRLMLFEHGEQWRCARAVGADAAAQAIDAGALIGRFRDIQFIGAELEGAVHGFDIAVPVHHLEKPLALLLIGDIDDSEQRMSPTVKHLNFIQTLTNLIAVALENKRLAQQALLQERDKRELELAAEMQSMLIPGTLPNDARLKAAAWYLPHRQVGGDYYDLIRIGEHEVLVCVADVSGKGMAAALFMAFTRSTIRASAMLTTSPASGIAHANQLICADAARGFFVTLFYALLNTTTGELTYVNAGHNPPLLYRIAEDRLTRLMPTGMALGADESARYRQETLHLNPGDFMLLYTDGVTDAMAAREQYGMDRLQQVVMEQRRRSAAGMVQALHRSVEAFSGAAALFDDLTIVMVKCL